MNIYLACTVRGDRAAVGALRAITERLERQGHTVLTHHLLDDNVDSAEAALTERDVFDRDMEWLRSAEVIIAEASGSSYGVGFEVGYVLGRAERSGQRVLLLYNASRRRVISRLISGNTDPHCTTCSYETPADLQQIVETFVAPVAGTMR